MQPTDKRANLWMDLLLVALLIALNVAARLLPHAPGFLPVAASGLFAARVLSIPVLALLVPILGMILSDAALPGEDWRIQAVGFAAIAIPAIAGIATQRGSSARAGGHCESLQTSAKVPIGLPADRTSKKTADGQAATWDVRRRV